MQHNVVRLSVDCETTIPILLSKRWRTTHSTCIFNIIHKRPLELCLFKQTCRSVCLQADLHLHIYKMHQQIRLLYSAISLARVEAVEQNS